MSNNEAIAYYKNLMFYYLVTDLLGVKGGTLVAVDGLVVPPFMHPGSVGVKDMSGVKMAPSKYLEISSFGWCAHPYGISLNAARGSGIFWSTGTMLISSNKVAAVYMLASNLENTPYTKRVYTSGGYSALVAALKKYDDGRMMKRLVQISTATSTSLEDVVKNHVSGIAVDIPGHDAYDLALSAMGMKVGYDSCMVDGGLIIDFRVVIDGSLDDGIINDDIRGKWDYFQSKYLSLRDPFDLDNESSVESLGVMYPQIMFSGGDAKTMCKSGPKCGESLGCTLMGCSPADTPTSWKSGQNLPGGIKLYTAGGISFGINNGENGMSMTNRSLTTAKILQNMKKPPVPKMSASELKSLVTQPKLTSFLKLLNIATPTSVHGGLQNYMKLTYPLSSKLWDTMSQNDLIDIYLSLDAHYMPLLLPIGKMTFPSCTIPTECVFPPSRNSRTQTWAFDGIHIEGASGSDQTNARKTKNYPDSTPYWYQHVTNPFDGGPHAAFDHHNMTLTEGGYPSYAWVESVQYADESGGIRLQGEYDSKSHSIVGPNSCECSPASGCATYVTREDFSGDIPCDPKYKGGKVVPCPIGKQCSGHGVSSYCSIPDTYAGCAVTYQGEAPPSTATCGSFDHDSWSWKSGQCSEADRCKWSLSTGINNPQTANDLFYCLSYPTDKALCAIPWSVNTGAEADTNHVPVTTTMYYPQKGYGKFTNYGKTAIYYSNVAVLLTIPDLNLRMSMEQIIQLVGLSVGVLSIYNQLIYLTSPTQVDPRPTLQGYVVLTKEEYAQIDQTKAYRIQNKRNVYCENPLINPGDDPRLKAILENFVPLYIPPEAQLVNPMYNKLLGYDYDTAIQLMMAMYIHGCTGQHSEAENFPFGSYNSYGMNLGHITYVRTIAMGWNTIQLARDPDYSGNSLKYCEWPFYDYEIIHVAAKPPPWVKSKSKGYGFDMTVGGVWAEDYAPKPYVFCKGMFLMDITKFLPFYTAHGYLPGSGDWKTDLNLFNPTSVNRNIFRQGQLGTDQFATTIRPYYTTTTWGAKPIIYDQTCPFPEWWGTKCNMATDPMCVDTPAGEGIYYQAMHSTTPTGSWPLGK